VYYDKQCFNEPRILRLAQDLGGKYIIDFRRPAYGEEFVKDGLGLMISNGGKFLERFIVSSTPPLTPPPGAFGKVYPRGIKCDGTWIPLDFKKVEPADYWVQGIAPGFEEMCKKNYGKIGAAGFDTSSTHPRLIIQKIEKSVKSEEKEKQMFLTPEDLRKFRFESRAEEIYPAGVPVPTGFEVVDFCPPVSGENYISPNGMLDSARGDWLEPRLIVAPKAQRDWQAEIDAAAGGGNWKVPEGWRVAGYGTPKKGQYYLSPGMGYTPLAACYDFTNSHFILVEKSPATFTFDGVEFTVPEGWEFVRVGYLKGEEKAKGWKHGYMDRLKNRVEKLNVETFSSPCAIFQPAQKA
jgi:hypothetical protein